MQNKVLENQKDVWKNGAEQEMYMVGEGSRTDQ
jgi:hypothetical protein